MSSQDLQKQVNKLFEDLNLGNEFGHKDASIILFEKVFDLINDIATEPIDLNKYNTIDTRLKLDVDITTDGVYTLVGSGYIGIPNNTTPNKLLYITGGKTILIYNSEADLITIIGSHNYSIEFRNLEDSYNWNDCILLPKNEITSGGGSNLEFDFEEKEIGTFLGKKLYSKVVDVTDMLVDGELGGELSAQIGPTQSEPFIVTTNVGNGYLVSAEGFKIQDFNGMLLPQCNLGRDSNLSRCYLSFAIYNNNIVTIDATFGIPKPLNEFTENDKYYIIFTYTKER